MDNQEKQKMEPFDIIMIILLVILVGIPFVAANASSILYTVAFWGLIMIGKHMF